MAAKKYVLMLGEDYEVPTGEEMAALQGRVSAWLNDESRPVLCLPHGCRLEAVGADAGHAANLLRQAAAWLWPSAQQHLPVAALVDEMSRTADLLDGRGVSVPPAEPAPAPDPGPKVKFREWL